MFEFEVLQEIAPNKEIFKIIKNYRFIVKSGKVKHLLNTNLKFIVPTEYRITYPKKLQYLNRNK